MLINLYKFISILFHCCLPKEIWTIIIVQVLLSNPPTTPPPPLPIKFFCVLIGLELFMQLIFQIDEMCKLFYTCSMKSNLSKLGIAQISGALILCKQCNMCFWQGQPQLNSIQLQLQLKLRLRLALFSDKFPHLSRIVFKLKQRLTL